MKQAIIIVGAALTAVVVTATAWAQAPAETPFPAPKVQPLFVAAQTVTASSASGGVLQNQFLRGSNVVFRVFAGETKKGNVLSPTEIRYAYVKIPNQPSVKLKYVGPFAKGDPDARWPWTAIWTIPNDYALGLVNFKVLIKTKTGLIGSFVQLPVVSAQLTVRQ